MDFLKRWLKEEFILFLWGWGIVLLIIIFSMIAVSLFPDIAINLIGLFVLLIIGFHVVVWFKVKNLSLIHISEPTRLGMISYAVFCLKKKKKRKQ